MTGPFPTPTHAAQHWYDRAKAAEAERDALDAELAQTKAAFTETQRRAKAARSIAAAPDYDPELIAAALWDTVDAALASTEAAA